MQISNFEPVYQNQTKRDDVAVCEKCKGTWFEQFTVKQFKTNHSAVLGQFVPSASNYEFVVLRCIKCDEKYQPNILAQARDQAAKAYDEFIEELEDKKKPVEEVKPIDLSK